MDKRSLTFLLLTTLSFFGIRYYYEIERQQRAPLVVSQSAPAAPTIRQEEPLESATFEMREHSPQEKNTLYMLESPYQQLVISARGGSIVEINLPFHTSIDKESSVHPISIDKELIAKKSPASFFPLSQSIRSDGSVMNPQEGGFYPLLRRSTKTEDLSSSGLLLLSYQNGIDTSLYSPILFTKDKLVLEAKLPNKIIKKTFSFPKDPQRYPYCIDVEIEIVGNKKDLSITSGTPDVELISGTPGTTLKYRLLKGEKSEVVSLDLPSDEFRSTTISPDWTATSNGFFTLILDPIQGTKPGLTFRKLSQDIAPSRLTELPQFSSIELPGYRSEIPLDTNAPLCKTRLYAGPLSENVFALIDKSSKEDGLSKPTNYKSCISYHGWFSFISEPFAKFLYFIMQICHSFVGSWTLCIILATVVLRILMYPLNRWSQQSMLRMREISPQVKAIQERYKKDPKKAQVEIMTLYRERGVNPFSGCLPLLIQMPFLIGMFDLLKSTYALRGDAFIPGWIDDLSQPDRLFSWGISIPFLGSYFHLLPFLLGIVMWWQQKLSSPAPQDVSKMTDTERQQRAMGNIMTVVMTVMFYHFPAGLNIYWLSSMLLSIAQQVWTNRQFASKKRG